MKAFNGGLSQWPEFIKNLCIWYNTCAYQTDIQRYHEDGETKKRLPRRN